MVLRYSYKPNTDFYQESIALKLMERSNKIGLKTYFFDKYIRNIKTKFSQVNSLKSLVKKCDVIFISYEDIFVLKNKRSLIKAFMFGIYLIFYLQKY